MPVLYILSGRTPPTFAYVHWWDVTPDHIARGDAKILRTSMPAVLVVMEFPAEKIKQLEREFRGSAQSGQRELLYTIAELSRSYRRVESLPAPGAQYRVNVFVRPTLGQ
jgi:hypothetical protein